MPTPDQVRAVAHLADYYRLVMPIEPVCRGHHSPAEILAVGQYERPSEWIVHGPRGGGKGAGAGFDTYLMSSRYAGLKTTILAGSLAQAEQIYDALSLVQDARPETPIISTITKTKATFCNGSEVNILAASGKQVRGPHVAQLRLDEVDEIDPEIREAGMPMAMAMQCRDTYTGQLVTLQPSIPMTSTWHRVSGPMAELTKRIKTFTFCVWEVLERCPEERSGRELENCPACPLVQWCHADRDLDPLNRPKAKRSSGHYTIDSLIQKTKVLSDRSFESDMLCGRPREAGMWFTTFDHKLHVSEDARFRSGIPFHVAIDPGVHTGAVWFQVQRNHDASMVKVNVFGDYYWEGRGAEENAREIVEKTMALTGMGIQYARVSMDPAGRQRTAVGPTVRGEYNRVGCVGRSGELLEWPTLGQGRPKADSLELLSSLLKAADGTVSLQMTESCKHLTEALESYRRRKVDDQWIDEPEPVQHPAEEHVDALVGGLTLEFPAGRAPKPKLRDVHAGLFA